jgi:hypothetical protein
MVLASSYCEPKGEKPATSALWPWIEQPLCRDFLAALLAAYGAGCFSLAYLGEWSAAVGGSIAILVAFGGFALQVTVAGSEGHDIGLAVPAIVLAVIAPPPFLASPTPAATRFRRRARLTALGLAHGFAHQGARSFGGNVQRARP